MKKAKRSMFLVGRVLVGLFYLFTGANHFLDLGPMTAYADSMGVPLPAIAVMLSGLLLLAAGISFLVGLWPELGILALVIFYVPVSVSMHPFWTMTGEAAQTEMISFIKNMALLGSALCFAALPRPWPYSVEQKMEKAPQAPKQKASAAG